MKDFHVFIERQGEQIYAGRITGSGSEDAVFSYAQEYLDNPSSCPISIGEKRHVYCYLRKLLIK